MDGGLRYVTVDKDFKDIPGIEKIYNNAFPPDERLFTVEEVMEHIDGMGQFDIVAVYDGDILAGFYALTVNEELNYRNLQFLAVNNAVRGKGYGSRILTKLLDDNKDRIFFASIEKPDPEGEDYEIKIRRQQFYEKNGMITVDREKDVNGVRFIMVTNKTGEEFDRCSEFENREEAKQVRMAAAMRQQ